MVVSGGERGNMSIIGTYDSTVYSNPVNKYCVIRIKTTDQGIPEKARDKRRYRDHLIRFTADGRNGKRVGK